LATLKQTDLRERIKNQIIVKTQQTKK